MDYEHGLFTQGIEIDWSVGDSMEHAEALRGLAQIWFPQLEANIAMSGDEWELLSHDVTATPTGALLSILGRRPSKTV